MPELPEVVVVSSQLNKNIVNKTINNVFIYNNNLIKEVNSKEFISFLMGEKILKVTNYGKFIVFYLSNNKVLLSHLRMEGKYFYYKNKLNKQKHDYVIFEFSDKSYLHYNDTRMFGTFHIRTDKNYNTTNPLAKLSKVPWELNANDLYMKLQKRKQKIKTALLDQTLILGLGNIYVDEVLFASNLNPETKTNELSLKKVKEIIANSTLILKKSIELGGSSIDSYTSLNKQEGQYQNFLKVHTKKGHPCKVCKSIILKTKINGRGTYFCPLCQKVVL
ncbi:DNA-formamidopyrimidine glycosylase [[Mycoplasma] collis]|uniref:DNA-formamidopyrimidine glycosylase n=1 Tax=[Mycoplasma] collis TaxID=2127 RepID=UPI00051B0505|nr:DNA-formamidopyrimidine glycosylase [[Mycoplasma] collis]